MADRTWILAALIDGPEFRTLRVSGRYSVDHDVLRAMIESRHRAMEDRRPGTSHAVLMATAEATADEGDPARWSAIVDAGRPFRQKLVTHDHVSVNDGIQCTSVSRDMAVVRPATTDDHLSSPLGDLLEPQFLAVGYDIGEPVETDHLGRRCVAVTASVKPVSDPTQARSRYEFGDRARIMFDLETGLIVKWQSWFEGADLGDMALDEFGVDEPVADDAFTAVIPPGIPVRTAEQLRDEMQARRPLRRLPTSPEETLDDYMIRGEPPLDPTAAEGQIRHAVEGLAEVSPDGQNAVNVHGGEGLGAALKDAATRQPLEVRFALDAVRFLSAEEAAIAFRVEGGVSMSFEGRAMLVDDQWLLERRTVTQLLRLAGATIPPPPSPR